MILLRALRDVVGDQHVLTDPALTASYRTDWTGRFAGDCDAVVRPADVVEVSDVVAICHEYGVAVTPQGGNTGLVGGSVPGTARGVVLSLTRLRELSDVRERVVTAAAGVTVAQLQRHAAEAGLQYAVDIGARESATIGGSIATDAGGLRMCAYGSTRDQVIAVQAVLADGTVLDEAPLAEVVGSEGTLAVITAATLLLREPIPDRITALVPVSGIEEALTLLRPGMLAAEYVERSALRLTGGPDVPAVLLLETTSEADVPHTALVASDAKDVARMWSVREATSEQVARLGVPLKLDVAVPLDRLAAFRADLDDVTDGAELYLWGHLAEGKLHVNLIGADVERHTEAVLSLVIAHGGNTCSEHGVGRAKVEWFARQQSEESLQSLRERKRRYDPAGTLNPGVRLSVD